MRRALNAIPLRKQRQHESKDDDHGDDEAAGSKRSRLIQTLAKHHRLVLISAKDVREVGRLRPIG
jgi:hypothetical protein